MSNKTMEMPDAERERRIKEIVGDDAIREKRCLSQIQIVLQRFDCVMIPEVIVGGGQIRERVRIAAIPRVGAAAVPAVGH